MSDNKEQTGPPSWPPEGFDRIADLERRGYRVSPELRHMMLSRSFLDPEGVEDDALDRAWERRRQGLGQRVNPT